MSDIAVNVLENVSDQWLKWLGRVYEVIQTSPQEFRDGTIWSFIENIFNGFTYLGTALLVIAFFFGITKMYTSLDELRRPEVYVRMLFRIVIAELVIQNALKLIEGLINTVGKWTTNLVALGGGINEESIIIDSAVTDAIGKLGFFKALVVWAIAFILLLVVTILGIYLLITVYGRFFKIYIMTALAPIPLAGLGGEPTTNITVQFAKSYFGVLLEGMVIMLAAMIFSAWGISPPSGDISNGELKYVLDWAGEYIIGILVFVGTVKMSDDIVHRLGF